MKIAFLVHEFPPQIGGIAVRANRISQGLGKRGHEIKVYTSSYPGAPRTRKMGRIKIQRYNLLSPYVSRLVTAPMRIMPGMLKLIGSKDLQDVDVIQSFFFLEFVSLVAACIRLVRKKAFVLDPLFFPYYSPRITRKYAKWSVIPYRLTVGNTIIKAADFLAPETSSEKSHLIQLGASPKKIEVIPNAIDPQHYKQRSDPNIFRDKFEIAPEDKIILFLSRPTVYKGVEHLILAMRNVVNEEKRAKLIIAGPHVRRPHILRDSLPPSVRDRILITGPITEECKMSAFAASDLFVLPSKIETFGIALLEAAAAGLPIVSTRTGVAEDIVTNGKNGLFVGWSKINQLSIAIVQMLRDDRFKKEAEKTRNIVLEKYDVDKEIDQYEKIYTLLTH